MSKQIKNLFAGNKTYAGLLMAQDAIQTLEDTKSVTKAIGDDKLLNALTSDPAEASIIDSESGNEFTGAEAIQFLLGVGEPHTSDGRMLTASNRIPPGYSVYPTGRADNITAGTFGDGDKLKLDKDNLTVEFQLLSHFYGIGGKAVWEDASGEDEVKATLCAPATIATEQAGDWNKYDLGGYNMYVPAAPGAGAWDMDINEKQTNTEILKAIPVPSPGNNGYFDYDSDTNVLTVNATGTGSYVLLDIEVSLFRFANAICGLKGDNFMEFEATDVVGKLLYNAWKLKFELTKVSIDPKCFIIMNTGAKKNV